MGTKLSPEYVNQLLSSGRATVNGKKPRKPRKPAPFVVPNVSIEGGKLVALIPYRSVSEANDRFWRSRWRRTKVAKEKVWEVLGPYDAWLRHLSAAYHNGKTLRVVLTRIGGRKLDRLANLGASLKGIEDALAVMILADDGDERWQASCTQEPGPGPVGVRITIEVEP